MRRRTAMLVAAVLVALVAASGAALAENIAGGNGDNRLVGTGGRDVISGAGGNDDIYGKGDQDRLFGDTGDDNVYGGRASDRLQSGLGQDDLFGQKGNDFANVIDGQPNDTVDCGGGDNDLAGIDVFPPLGPGEDQVSDNCEVLYIAIPDCPCPNAQRSSADSVARLSEITTLKEAERAVEAGLLKKIDPTKTR
jgi:hypothetical protein